MLDINKVAKQLPGIGQHLIRENAANQQRLQLATASLQQAIHRQVELAEIQQQWQQSAIF